MAKVKTERERLVAEAKTCIEQGNLKKFRETIGQTYETQSVAKYETVTRHEEHYGGGGKQESAKSVPIYKTTTHSYFRDQDLDSLFSHAHEKNALPVLNWFLDQGQRYIGKYYEDGQNYFKDFCKKNDKGDAVEIEGICERQLLVALNHNDSIQAGIVLRKSPIYKENTQLSKRLEIIEPLFIQLQRIDKMASKENSAELKQFSHEARADIHDFLTGKIDGETFHEKLNDTSEKSMGKLQKQWEGMTILKDFLFALTIIGPAIKAAMGYGAGFDNTTTAKVRDTKNAVMDMKEQLKQMKQEQKAPEKVAEVTPEEPDKPVTLSSMK